MTLDEFSQRIDALAEAISKLSEALFPEKGGPGSGCNPNVGRCGRPAEGTQETESEMSPPRTPRSGVRPSAVNPNRREIEYNEEPRTRPRSGISPSRLGKDGEFDEATEKFIREFLLAYNDLMTDLQKLEALEKIHRHRGESMEDCVSRGIRTLIAEGYAQDQATAMAYKMCGEKGACTCPKE